MDCFTYPLHIGDFLYFQYSCIVRYNEVTIDLCVSSESMVRLFIGCSLYCQMYFLTIYDFLFFPRYTKVTKSLPCMSSSISKNSTLSIEIFSPFTITQEISSGIQLQMSSSMSQTLQNQFRLVNINLPKLFL
jgi:hypothetical protein